MSLGNERGESSHSPLAEAFFRAKHLLTHPELDSTRTVDLEMEGEDFALTMVLKWGHQIEAECRSGKLAGRIFVGEEKRIAFDLSQEHGLEGLVFFGSHLRIFDKSTDTGAKIGMGISEMSINPVPPEKRQEFGQLAVPFVEWLEKYIKTGEMMPLQFTS